QIGLADPNPDRDKGRCNPRTYRTETRPEELGPLPVLNDVKGVSERPQAVPSGPDAGAAASRPADDRARPPSPVPDARGPHDESRGVRRGHRGRPSPSLEDTSHEVRDANGPDISSAPVPGSERATRVVRQRRHYENESPQPRAVSSDDREANRGPHDAGPAAPPRLRGNDRRMAWNCG